MRYYFTPDISDKRQNQTLYLELSPKIFKLNSKMFPVVLGVRCISHEGSAFFKLHHY